MLSALSRCHAVDTVTVTLSTLSTLRKDAGGPSPCPRGRAAKTACLFVPVNARVMAMMDSDVATSRGHVAVGGPPGIEYPYDAKNFPDENSECTRTGLVS